MYRNNLPMKHRAILMTTAMVMVTLTIYSQKQTTTMPEIKSFRINAKQEVLDNLQLHLKTTTWPGIAQNDHNYGGPSLEIMKGLAEKVKNFDWRKAESQLNQLPHFRTEIDGQNIHFIHVLSKVKGAMPLLLIHGWPGSFIEFIDVIEPLTNPPAGHQAFHVVIPSLPGFGFSGPPKDAGWNLGRISNAMLTLMERLNYNKFAVQGGDAGAIIGPAMARIAPEKFIGVHVNAATLGFIPFGPLDDATMASLTANEKVRLQRMQDFLHTKFGFNLLHSHQPQLISFAIADSPVGLMAWMSQLFSPEQLEDKFILNFMIYWITGTASSSILWYYESAHDPNAWTPKPNSGVPTGVAVFQDEDVAIRKIGEETNNIVRWNEYPFGGHYAVMRAQDVWLKDVREFFGDLTRRR